MAVVGWGWGRCLLPAATILSPHVLHAARPWDTSLQALFSAWPFLPGFGSCSGIVLRPGPGAFLVLAEDVPCPPHKGHIRDPRGVKYSSPTPQTRTQGLI